MTKDDASVVAILVASKDTRTEPHNSAEIQWKENQS